MSTYKEILNNSIKSCYEYNNEIEKNNKRIKLILTELKNAFNKQNYDFNPIVSNYLYGIKK